MKLKFLAWLERQFNIDKDLGSVSLTKLYDINAAATRNRWYDRKGQPWPLRDSL